MTDWLIAYYLGLTVFALNGIIFYGMQVKGEELKAQEKRLVKLIFNLNNRRRR